MLTYAELREKALQFFPLLLKKMKTQRHWMGGLFACVPSISVLMDFREVQIISDVASVVAFYNEDSVDDERRKEVLIGIYLFVWHQYNSGVTSYLYKELLLQLSTHIVLHELTLLQQKIALMSLQTFCHWVCEHRHEALVGLLWKRMPADMQPLLDRLIEKTSISYSLPERGEQWFNWR